MANRICSLCGQGYTDKDGHNYDICVEKCIEQIGEATAAVHKAYKHYHEAVHIQRQDWWKRGNSTYG